MNAIALRLAAVVAIVATGIAAVAIANLGLGAPRSSGSAPVDDSDAFAADGSTGVPRHELVRYDMPDPHVVPPLQGGVSSLTFADLWADGAYDPPSADGDRVGAPARSEFPDGTTDEDVANFYLDIADMRQMQLLAGRVKRELDGQRVRIAGYTTPVGFAEDEQRFLLVPELGACIHVPPPPPNQIVYVETADTTPQMFAPVWITGTLRARPVATILADAGYTMDDVTTEPYR